VGTAGSASVNDAQGTTKPAPGDAGTAIIGREAALAAVQQALDEGQAVALVGPAGIGKTALAKAAIASRGSSACAGAAVDYLQSRPFLPLVRIVGRPLRRGDGAAVAAEVRAVVGDAVLLLDDLQWSDADTIEALPMLAASGPLILTVRPGGDTARRAIKQIDTAGTVIDLRALDDADALRLARLHLPPDEADGAAAIVKAAGGNPLAIEAVAHMRANDRSARAATLRAVIEACPRPERETLARLGLRDPLVGGDTPGVSDLVERRLAEITPDGAVRPAAELFAELALESLPQEVRAALHGQRAEDACDAGEAALHWAAAGEIALAHDAALEAAREAETLATRARFAILASETAPLATRWVVTREAIQVLLDLGRLDETRPLAERLATEEPPTVSDAIDRELLRVRFALEARQSHDVIELTDRALDELEADMSPAQLASFLVQRAAAKGELVDIAGAVADARASASVAEAAGLPTTRARMILSALDMVVGNDRWQSELPAVFREMVDNDEHSNAFEAGRLLALSRFFAGDNEGGVAACDDMIEVAATLNNRAWDRGARSIKAGNRSLFELAREDIVGELRCLVDDPAIGSFRHSASVLLAVAEGDLGNFERADEIVQSTTDHARRWRSESLEGLSLARIEIAWSAGRLEECAETARELLTNCQPLDFGTPAAAVALRWVSWEQGGDCRELPGPLVIFPVQRGLIDEARAIELWCAPDGDRDAAGVFLEAADKHDRYLRRNALRCRWAAGEALRRAGDLDDAARILHEVRDVCTDRGFEPLGRRVDASLRGLGAAPRQMGTASGGLTQREAEVLALVRQGLSTGEIATRLRLRPCTIDSHIRKAMKRLGASNRREAALLVDDDD
jgi:DNA-binding CsgD family transcriptional regulator